jgi:hypothetical protein
MNSTGRELWQWTQIDWAIGQRWPIVLIALSKGEGYSQLTFGTLYAFG